MNTTKVKRDRHGLYVRAGGYIFRPAHTPYSYPVNPRVDDRRDYTSGFSDGADVRARAIAGAPFARVEADGALELWHSHGTYYDKCGRTISSEHCWTPLQPTNERNT